MNDNGSNNGGGSIGGDSDGSMSETTVCRDFIRNVCHRGNNCRFIHPENVKVRTDPIFCHDFQQGRCFRSNCKFIHCSKEEEDHYKQTGELPEGYDGLEEDAPPPAPKKLIMRGKSRGSGGMGVGVGRAFATGNGTNNGDSVEIPLCKDFLKGQCDRPPGGCKFRHITRPTAAINGPASGFVRPTRGRGMMRGGPSLTTAVRRVMQDPYDEGPEAKRYQSDDYSGYYEEYEYEEEAYAPVPTSHPRGYVTAAAYQHPATYPTPHTYGTQVLRNGYHTEAAVPYFHTSHSDTMKALEDENFMLKRRIEELKSSNEFLLNQNAQLRLNNSLTAGTSVTQVQPIAAAVVSVSGAVPSAQQSIIGITSSSLSATQPLPTISISTLPTVIPPVSISQTLQATSQSQAQIYLPSPN